MIIRIIRLAASGATCNRYKLEGEVAIGNWERLEPIDIEGDTIKRQRLDPMFFVGIA